MYHHRMSPVVAPTDFLQLAGHPVRWELLGELGRSDRTVRELTERVDQPQNLVSYHLAKLRDAHIVFARRSTADRRDTYYAVDVARIGELLTATGRAVHPGLNLVAPSLHVTRPAKTKTRILFLCTGNSARSQMAEALVRSRAGKLVDVRSAGSDPKPLHPSAVRVMREDYGVDIARQRSKHLSAFADERFDRVISLCDRVREACPRFPGEAEMIHWSIPDPSALTGDDDVRYAAFKNTAAELDARIGYLLAGINDPSNVRGKER